MGARDDVGVRQPAGAQHEGSLRELVTILQTELAERIERERVHELEIAAQRHELAVRFEYEATLEERLRECREHIEQQDEAGMLSADRRRLAAELAAEQQHAEDARHERDRVQAELDAERSRVSYRAVQRAAVWLHRHRVVSRVVRVVGRVVATRSTVPETPPARS